jgi:YidC/Oxa1 family membrane protein insertase
MSNLFQTILVQPLTYALTSIASAVGGYGLAIIILTIVIRLILLPVTLPSMKMAAKMRDLQPELNKLKKIHGKDKAALQQAQLALYKEHNLNPASGCLPNILQFVILIALYQVINGIVKTGDPTMTHFIGFDISQPAPYFILPIIAAITQLILGLMLMPATDTSAEHVLADSTLAKKDDKDANDMSSMANTMQQQMIFMMPLMTLFLAFKFPAGLTLYWITTTVFSIGQQYLVSGWGGLPQTVTKSKTWINARLKRS